MVNRGDGVAFSPSGVLTVRPEGGFLATARRTLEALAA
jgi:hypothetical protein